MPLYAPGSARYAMVEGTWQNWACEFQRAAERHDVPVSWLLAIAAVETGPWWADAHEQETIVSYAGARGIMQVMPSTARLLDFNEDAMFRAPDNIDAGAKLIAQLARAGYGLPAITGPYNSGQRCCSSSKCRPGCQNQYGICTASDYPGAAIRYNNTAIAYLDLHAGCSPGLMSAVVAGGAVAGVWWLWQRYAA